MKITVPENIKNALGLLERAGFEAYAVGGCVRDCLLGKAPYDWDVCTSAKPQQTMAAFAAYRTIPTGIKHGTVTVIIGEPVEITTFRVDGEYVDNRRPESVEFTKSLKEDLCRRDFTVNAMAANAQGKIFDFYGGAQDLLQRRICCVGVPQKRFEEDALRIMRALRFSATLGFEIEEETARAIFLQKHLLKNIAAERITAELSKLILGRCAGVLMRFADVLQAILPGVEITPETALQVENSPPQLEIRLAVLLQEKNAQSAEELLRQMRFSNGTIKSVVQMLEYKSFTLDGSKAGVKLLMHNVGAAAAKNIIAYQDALGRILNADELLPLVDFVVENAECYNLSGLAVKGSDLKMLKVPDKKIGEVLAGLLLKVIYGELANEREALLAAVQVQY